MLDLSPAELQTLAGLLDAGVRHVGLRAISEEALSIVRKIEVASQAPIKPAEPTVLRPSAS